MGDVGKITVLKIDIYTEMWCSKRYVEEPIAIKIPIKILMIFQIAIIRAVFFVPSGCLYYLFQETIATWTVG